MAHGPGWAKRRHGDRPGLVPDRENVMSPTVLEILLKARKDVYDSVALRFTASDMQALHVLSCLLVTDFQCGNEAGVDLSEDNGDSATQAELKRVQAELKRVEAERAKDSAIINGLLKRGNKPEGRA